MIHQILHIAPDAERLKEHAVAISVAYGCPFEVPGMSGSQASMRIFDSGDEIRLLLFTPQVLERKGFLLTGVTLCGIVGVDHLSLAAEQHAKNRLRNGTHRCPAVKLGILGKKEQQ